MDSDLEFDQLPAKTQSRALVAAAQRVSRADRTETERIARRRSTNGWQDDAWAMYDAIGEIKYGFNLVAWAISRCRVYAAVLPDEGGSEPVAAHDVLDLTPGLAEASTRALNRLGTGPAMSELLRSLAINMQVAGECWLVQQPRGIMNDRPEKWMIKSVNELKVGTDGTFTVQRSATGGMQDTEEIPANAYVARLWRNHPRYYENADSSMLGVLDKCDELLMLDRMVRAVARSRINAGILAISENFSLLDDPEDEPDPVRFEDEFQFAMTQPVSDESSASAVVPLLLRGPLDEIQNGIKFYEVARTVSADLVARADRCLERILQGIDLPKDMVTGLAQVKYSNALVISDSLYSAHIQPLLQLICDQLTEAYLRTAVTAYGFTDEQAKRLVVWYDASEILQDADKSQSANAGVSNYALSFKAWRRENGYAEADAPSANELVLRILLARAGLEDPTAQSIIRTIAPTLMEAAGSADQASSVGPLTPDVQSILQGVSAAPPADAAAAPPAATPPPVPPPAAPPQPPLAERLLSGS
jgi:hypothetical protein